MTSINACAEERDGVNEFIFYPREVIRKNSPDLLAFAGLYNYHASLATIQFGARIGVSEGNVAQWDYKLELTSKSFMDNYKASLRLLKKNNYTSNSTRDTILIERLAGSFDPFKKLDSLERLSIDSELGLSQTFSSTAGSAILPGTSGNLTLTPLFALRLNYRPDSLQQTHSFAFSNFDVFDPYPMNQPFLQIETVQALDNCRVFGYIRYRWDNSISQFYALYLTIGVEIPY
ncbi:hypothetical protein [Candidatus Methylospira mobilis]|nr:hypothetical protein [Candidatus Methylospira mobilis]